MDDPRESSRSRRRRRKFPAISAPDYGDVFGGPPRFAAARFVGVHVEYSEIFGGVASSCYIPYLDLPSVVDGSSSSDVGGDYTEIFSRSEFDEFAVPYEELSSVEDKDEDGRILSWKWPRERDQAMIVEDYSDGQRILSLGEDGFLPVPEFIDEGVQHFSMSCNRMSRGRTEDLASTSTCTIQALASSSYTLEENNTRDDMDKGKPSLSTFSSYSTKCSRNDAVADLNGKTKGCTHEGLPNNSALSSDLGPPENDFYGFSGVSLRGEHPKLLPPTRSRPKLDSKSENSNENAWANQENYTTGYAGTCSSKTPSLQTDGNVIAVPSNSIAATSAAAMKEAIELAQAKLKVAKELMERKKKKQTHTPNYQDIKENEVSKPAGIFTVSQLTEMSGRDKLGYDCTTMEVPGVGDSHQHMVHKSSESPLAYNLGTSAMGTSSGQFYELISEEQRCVNSELGQEDAAKGSKLIRSPTLDVEMQHEKFSQRNDNSELNPHLLRESTGSKTREKEEAEEISAVRPDISRHSEGTEDTHIYQLHANEPRKRMSATNMDASSLSKNTENTSMFELQFDGGTEEILSLNMGASNISKDAEEMHNSHLLVDEENGVRNGALKASRDTNCVTEKLKGDQAVSVDEYFDALKKTDESTSDEDSVFEITEEVNEVPHLIMNHYKYECSEDALKQIFIYDNLGMDQVTDDMEVFEVEWVPISPSEDGDSDSMLGGVEHEEVDEFTVYGMAEITNSLQVAEDELEGAAQSIVSNSSETSPQENLLRHDLRDNTQEDDDNERANLFGMIEDKLQSIQFSSSASRGTSDEVNHHDTTREGCKSEKEGIQSEDKTDNSDNSSERKIQNKVPSNLKTHHVERSIIEREKSDDGIEFERTWDIKTMGIEFEQEGNTREEQEEEAWGERFGRMSKEEKVRKWERHRERFSGTHEAHGWAPAEAHNKPEEIAMERITAVWQRASFETRERQEKAFSESYEKSMSEMSSIEARIRAVQVAAGRAIAEAQERSVEKGKAGEAAEDERERLERFITSFKGRIVADFQKLKLKSTEHDSLAGDVIAMDFIGEGGPTLRSKATNERQRRAHDRAAKALADKTMQDLIIQRDWAEHDSWTEQMDAKVKRWLTGKEGNLRALLSSLHYILEPESGWQPVPLANITTTGSVKKAYKRATLCVHPDKLQQRCASDQETYLCEKVFGLLKEAWNRFSLEDGGFEWRC